MRLGEESQDEEGGQQAGDQQSDLYAFSQALVGKRKEAIDGRRNSGIELVWQEDEDAYEGIDDLNRDEAEATYKPRNIGGAFEYRGTTRNRHNKSTVFLNITRPYTDTASARVGDMLLPTDDKGWEIKPTPIPELAEVLQQRRNAGEPDVPEDQLRQFEQDLKEIKTEANKRAEKASKRIEDWHVECNFQAEARKLIDECAKLGTGVIKGPVSKLKKYNSSMQDMIYPGSEWVSVWNCYPDPACGQDIQNGGYHFQKDYLTSRKVAELLRDETYVQEALIQVLKEGPNKINVDGTESRARQLQESDLFEVWYYYGLATPQDFSAAGTEEPDIVQAIPAVATMINDTVVKLVESPLESGDFPYDYIPWQRRQSLPFGIGISRQLRTPQRMINAATRNMMDNAGLSAGPQLFMRKGQVVPADGIWQITPMKLWWLTDDADPGKLDEILAEINISSHQGELLEIINFALKMGEETSGIPMIMQGQQARAAATLGEMQMQHNSANTVLRRIAKLFDDCVTEPHIRRYYEWLMLYGQEEEKGDFVVDARGSSALVERDIQNQAIQGMGEMVMNPAFGADPELWFQEFVKSQHLDPKKIALSDEKKEQMAQQQGQAPTDPRIETAAMQQQNNEAERQFKADQAEQERQHDMQMREMEWQMKAMEFAEKRNIQLDKLKKDLSQFTMGETNKRELFAAEAQLKVAQGSGI